MIGHLILEACEAAEQDGALFDFALDMADDDPPDERMKVAAAFLSKIRELRDRRRRRRVTGSA